MIVKCAKQFHIKIRASVKAYSLFIIMLKFIRFCYNLFLYYQNI